MSAALEAWLSDEYQRWWPLVTADDGTPDLFLDLVRRSEPHIESGKPFWPRWDADSAATPSSSIDLFALPEYLSEEWLAYRTRWFVFLQINPRLRLAWLLGQISQSHDGSSWPYGWSDRILDWVRSGFASDRPFDDRHGIDTSGMREVLRRLSEDGWVAWGEAEGRFVWTPAPVIEV